MVHSLCPFCRTRPARLPGELDARELVAIESQQALVAQIVGTFVEGALHGARDGEDAGIAGELGVGAGAGRRIVAISRRSVLPSLRMTETSRSGWSRPKP